MILATPSYRQAKVLTTASVSNAEDEPDEKAESNAALELAYLYVSEFIMIPLGRPTASAVADAKAELYAALPDV